MQAFRRRWSGDGLEGEQVGDGAGGSWEFEIGRIDDFLGERCAASDVDSLGTVMGFPSAGMAGCAGLSAAQIFGAGEFVSRVVDDFVGLETGCGVGTEAGNLSRNEYQHEKQKGFQEQGGDQAAVREDAVGSFTGETSAGAGEGGTDVGGEIAPTRSPLDQEPGRIVEVSDWFELESFGHGENY